MKWVKHLIAIALMGTWLTVGCGGDDEGDSPAATGGAAGFSASAGTAGSSSSTGGADGGTSSTTGGTTAVTAGAGGEGGVVSPPDTGCARFQEMCDEDADCCSGATCDTVAGICTSTIGMCKPGGDICEGATECCTFSCVNGACSETQCITDLEACTDSAECCSGTCTDGACVALNPACKTGGNACADNTDCCSSLCGDDGTCTLGASYCIQPGDVCVHNEDCCTAECIIADGELVGTCNIPPEGSTFCSGVDGVVCGGCGDCCSRLCAPYGDSGVNICQPISGCHSTGDLCRSDADCCGGTLDDSLPGYSNGQCDIEAGHAIGICRNPVNGEENPDGACSPQGNVCHLKDYACSVSSARNNCCGGLGNSGVCQPDLLGVPRCNGLGDTCRCGFGTEPDGMGGCMDSPDHPGETCASADDCCDDLPCVPDDQGVLRCGGAMCVMSGGSCTIDGDCCPGLTCIRPPGSTVGMCGVTMNDPECLAIGQDCSSGGTCCGDVPCTDGICKYPPQ